MNYATIKYNDVANGEGVRVSLFVSGCTHHCEGCFNAEAWDFSYGKPFGEAEIESILNGLDKNYIKGLSLLGGEPFEPQNQPALLELLRKFKEKFPSKDVWCYSGYDFDKHISVYKLGDPEITKEMLSYVDILVDGKFVNALKNPNLRFKGSSNQRIIDVKKSLEKGEVVLWDGDKTLNSMNKW